MTDGSPAPTGWTAICHSGSFAGYAGAFQLLDSDFFSAHVLIHYQSDDAHSLARHRLRSNHSSVTDPRFSMAQYVFTMHRLGKVVPPKREILKNISLSFFPGAKIGVLGLNGS